MPELNEDERAMYSLLPLLPVAQEEIYKKKIDDLVQRRQEAEDAEKRARDESERLEQVRADTGLKVAQATEKFNTDKAAHDAAATEAAARLKLLERTRAVLDKREEAMAEREHAVDNKEAEVKAQQAEVTNGEEKLRAHLEQVQIMDKSLRDKHAKLREILS